ncbi:MAG: DegV family protein [Peptostreptococcaceae bacterium]|jgi:DegV family protein with EDD domain|nr:DegV family protein [Peptostreptococcaceae bacterium]
MIKIVTDSVSDLPKDIIDEYNIKVIPLKVMVGGKEYKDGVDLDTNKMFKMLEENNNIKISTSQINILEFENTFKDVSNETKDILCITLSSALSGTYNCACQAKENLNDLNIEIVDSKGITLGFGLLVIKAAKLAKSGMDLKTIKAEIEKMRDNLNYNIVFDTLEYAYRGGRIKKSEYLLGNLFNIKPIITMKDGQMVVKEKVRGRKKAIKTIMNNIKKANISLDGKEIGINHANDVEYLNDLKNAILKEYNPKEIIESNVGCTVAVYSGLSAVALYYVEEE